MDIGAMLDNVAGYHEVFDRFEFTANGTGNRPWSHRYVNSQGDAIEFNANGWDLYQGGMCYTGKNYQELKAKLLESFTKEELIKMLTE